MAVTVGAGVVAVVAVAAGVLLGVADGRGVAVDVAIGANVGVSLGVAMLPRLHPATKSVSPPTSNTARTTA
ncbi:MAG: hypothetical protein FJ320_00095 [SAR202 cluster bacterium]|nr:hypothetical protein [SAR202 cluster bacterium]